MKIKIYIADDHQILLETLKDVLEKEGDIEVVATFFNSYTTIQGLRSHEPDILLLDLSMSEFGKDNTYLATGLDVLDYIKNNNIRTKVMVLSNYDDLAIIHKSLKSGARAYLLKNESVEVLKTAIKSVHEGHLYFSKSVKSKLDRLGNSDYNGPLILSKREREILDLVSKGFTTQEIADALSLHKDTVSEYRDLLLKKFDARNAPDLIRLAYQWKILNH